MSFDDIPENQVQSYPCECGGSIEPSMHLIAGAFGDPPDVCCTKWTCDKCDFYRSECTQEAQA